MADSVAAGIPSEVAPPMHSVRGRILLAEDDETNQLYALSLLEREGWAVDLARTGREAIALGSQHDYDAILMDCEMPELGGREAVAVLRRPDSASRETPVVAVTAHDSKSHRESCMAAGMDGYIVKPFDIATLHDALEVARTVRLQTTPAGASPAQGELDSLVDESRLAGLPQAIATRLIGVFISSTRQRVADLASAELDGDIDAARKLTHTLLGSSATIGATRMAAACTQLGAALRGGDADAIAARQADLELSFSLTEPALSTPAG
ncbi:MAG: response regulator [Solirubrobacteraceae bacterium]